MRKINLVGQKFERLIVIAKWGTDKYRNRNYMCLCDCNEYISIKACYLISGHTGSCGCLHREILRKHGRCRSSEYRSWRGMINRCNNKNNPDYHNYGGRGITVCKKWFKFINFFNDMGKKPKGLTIERINNNKGYYKENCKWATYIEQNHNQRIRKDNKTGTAGVSWDKRLKKYLSRICVKNKIVHLGYFDILEDAVGKRKQAELKYWGKP